MQFRQSIIVWMNTVRPENIFCAVRIMLYVLIVATVAWAFVGLPRGPQSDDTDNNQLAVLLESGNNFAEHRSLASYMKSIAASDLFRSAKTSQTRLETKSIKPKRNIQAVLAKYEILGVIWGETPKLILMNTSTGQSLTLAEGESFDQVAITKITRKKISLELFGEQFDASY